MKLIILRFDDREIYHSIEDRGINISAVSRNDISNLILLSIFHRHCIVALTDEAWLLYERAPINIRNVIDDVVEHHVINGSFNYWLEMVRHLGNTNTITKINHRRVDKFEVYCE